MNHRSTRFSRLPSLAVWTLRNETNAAEENIRGLESARLTTPGVMSILAHRPLGR